MKRRMLTRLGTVVLLCALAWLVPGPTRAADAPHPRGAAWLNRLSADFHGRSALACEDCHDPDRSCTSCHFGPGGSRVPPGSSWRHGRSGHMGQRTAAGVCTRCHEISRGLGRGPGRCHDCHGEGDEHGEEEREHRRGEHRRGAHEREHDD